MATEVIPVGWDGIFAWQDNGDLPGFTKSLKNDMVISCRFLPISWAIDGTAWESLIAADDACYVFDVSVEVECESVWAEVWAGTFSPKNWKINFDVKTITVKPKPADVYDCLKLKWDVPTNLYNVSGSSITVKPYILQYLHWEEIVDLNDPAPDVPGFCVYERIDMPVSDSGQLTIYHYHSYRKAGTCSGSTPVPPDTYNGWTLFSGSCPGTPIYWLCPTNPQVPYTYTNGRRFNDAFEALVDGLTCGLSVVSDFFGINPDSTHPDNEAYDAALLSLQRIVLFQKSDVKRHSSTNKSSASVWDMKLKALLSDLWKMFKVKAKIMEGDVLRVEHISYFEATAGADYTNESYVQELEPGGEDIVKNTRFEFVNKACSAYFAGSPITAYCGEGNAQVKCDLIATDVEFISNNDNAESITDDGWVLMATEVDGGDLRLLDNNRALSWTELHMNYHRHEMAAPGTINGADVTPLSLAKYREQPEFSVRHCCYDEFDPENYITTTLGQGKVKNAEQSLLQNILTVSLIY